MVNNLDILRYRYLAYFVIRDAIGFYFGIPKFMSDLDIDKVAEARLKVKLSVKPTDSEKQIDKHKRLILKSINSRVEYLKEDYEFCKDVLFEDNVWLELLDIDPQFFKSYLAKMPESVVNELAIIPSWHTRDEDLGRPYLSSQHNVGQIKF